MYPDRKTKLDPSFVTRLRKGWIKLAEIFRTWNCVENLEPNNFFSHSEDLLPTIRFILVCFYCPRSVAYRFSLYVLQRQI